MTSSNQRSTKSSGREHTIAVLHKRGEFNENSVRQYREANCLTQYQLAKLVGLTRRGILTLEKGENIPSLRNATRIAYVLGGGARRIVLYR